MLTRRTQTSSSKTSDRHPCPRQAFRAALQTHHAAGVHGHHGYRRPQRQIGFLPQGAQAPLRRDHASRKTGAIRHHGDAVVKHRPATPREADAAAFRQSGAEQRIRYRRDGAVRPAAADEPEQFRRKTPAVGDDLHAETVRQERAFKSPSTRQAACAVPWTSRRTGGSRACGRAQPRPAPRDSPRPNDPRRRRGPVPAGGRPTPTRLAVRRRPPNANAPCGSQAAAQRQRALRFAGGRYARDQRLPLRQGPAVGGSGVAQRARPACRLTRPKGTALPGASRACAAGRVRRARFQRRPARGKRVVQRAHRGRLHGGGAAAQRAPRRHAERLRGCVHEIRAGAIADRQVPKAGAHQRTTRVQHGGVRGGVEANPVIGPPSSSSAAALGDPRRQRLPAARDRGFHNREAASASRYSRALGCRRRMEAGQASRTGSVSMARTASALESAGTTQNTASAEVSAGTVAVSA